MISIHAIAIRKFGSFNPDMDMEMAFIQVN
jgi:hypothetical protein